ncbi:putative amidophosphoribosyltransferase [Nitrospina gracilis]|uniref:hypothetical protein n=1 Tax=Nitrospina sp. Nb-3 TaxID=2940485 RepID=UPI00034D16BE|nr:hypothetical protein [Nitrospina sp. Nb-3]MCF8724726.1 putative amidophosphoribosyltransferase [Nitrospina sp. Nb-3]
MTFIQCHQCQKEFEDGFQICPYCGAPYGASGAHYPRVPNWMFGAILVLFAVLASILFYSLMTF